MKKAILSLYMFFICGNLFSQQRYPGQWIMEIGGGPTLSTGGYYGEIGVEKIVGTPNNSLRFSLSYQNHKYELQDFSKLNVRDVNFFIGYGYTFIFYSPLNLSFIGGGFLGYEKVPNKIAGGVNVNANSKFNAGIKGAVQLECILSPLVSIYIQPTAILNFRSDMDDILALSSIGFKFYF